MSQQNRVAERKNIIIMNIIQSMLSEKRMAKIFWSEAVNWSVHVLNQSPTLVVRNKTPKQTWSEVKPSINYFRVFECISYVHVPDAKITKLDVKSLRCVLLGVSGVSKAYMIYDPISQNIIKSMDIIFEEDQGWDWDKKCEEANSCDLN